MDESKIIILGANGQLGTALREYYQKARSFDRSSLDITDIESVRRFKWDGVSIIINAAAYTNVDGAETPAGRREAWLANAEAVRNLTSIANENNILLVHISSDYVFDGETRNHSELEPLSPLSVYGASKAAGDIAAQLAKKHYIIRTSWVIGAGKNFVDTMLSLGEKGVNPSVVSDQIGRLTFTSELVRAIDHLLTKKSPFGTYNVSNCGEISSWADVARSVFRISGLDSSVTGITTDEYFAGKADSAQRPLNSVLALDKIQSTGFTSTDWVQDLTKHVGSKLTKKQ